MTFELSVKEHKIPTNSVDTFPLFDNYHSDFVSEPFAEFLQECFHTPYTVIVNPSSNDLVHLGKCYS